MMFLLVLNLTFCEEIENDCQMCQRTVYQLKFDKFADCGNGPCKNTCHKVVHSWYAPDRPFKDFFKDILGKCDVCFEAGFCSLTECTVQKSNEMRLIGQIVENGQFSGKIDKNTGKGHVVHHEEDENINKIKHVLRHSLYDSAETGEAEMAEREVGDIIQSVITPGKKLNEKRIILNNFKASAEVFSEFIDKAVDAMKIVFDDFGKTKDFKTVSPVENMKKDEKLHKKMSGKMKEMVKSVDRALTKNMDVISKTAGTIKKTIKAANDDKQKDIHKHHKVVLDKKKHHLDTDMLGDLLGRLTGILSHLSEKKQTLKSFKYRLQ